MKIKKIKHLLSKLDIDSLLEFENTYREKKDAILRDFWTFENVKCELASYIDCYMDDYLSDKISESAMALYYPNGFAQDFIVDDEMFLELTRSRSFEQLQGYIVWLEVIPGAKKSVNEMLDFHWDGYCEYYHTKTLNDFKQTIN
ncbi:hypothetical protein [Mucilaginibacter sp.]|uniref:hypothetical protein n=1 Tax=Mucilaginibacter sp. TaxID=1882438 RepID=UPI0025CE4DA6|nr:hypothetical protein [Mucilaginibacter sp.]